MLRKMNPELPTIMTVYPVRSKGLLLSTSQIKKKNKERDGCDGQKKWVRPQVALMTCKCVFICNITKLARLDLFIYFLTFTVKELAVGMFLFAVKWKRKGMKVDKR